jgi:heptosyltransferase-2
LGETGAILERADLFVSGNTGTMHIAAALKIPQVAIHGPTDPRRFGPLNEKAIVVMSKDPKSPCLYLGFEYENCSENSMSLVDYTEVLGASLEILEEVLSDKVQ